MKTMNWLLFLLALLILSAQSQALVITSLTENVAIPRGHHTISTDAKAIGYNPNTDTLTKIQLTLDFREIEDDGDDWDAGTLEFTTFYTTFFGERMVVYSDVDTQRFVFVRDWFYPDDCVDGFWVPCSEHPINTGLYSISLDVATNNLSLDQVRWDLHVNRAQVHESSAVLLFIFGIFSVAARRKKYSG